MKLQLNEDIYHLPGTWDELSTDQLCHIIKLVLKQLSAEEIKLKMLLYCIKGRVEIYTPTPAEMYFRLKVGKSRYDLSAEELYAISDIFSYLFIAHEGKLSINPLRTINPFPELKIRGKKYIGAERGMHNITYGQLVLLLTHFQSIQTNPEAINDFIAVLYQDCSSAMAAKLPTITKTAILWYYLGSMEFIANKFPITFSGDGKSSGNVFDSQQRAIDTLAGNDMTKKETVRNGLLYDALYTMEIAAENAEKQK